MPKTVQIRNIDDDVYAKLTRRAGEEGITVPELLRLAATRLAARPLTADVVAILDEWRGDWPDGGHFTGAVRS